MADIVCAICRKSLKIEINLYGELAIRPCVNNCEERDVEKPPGYNRNRFED